MADLSADDLRFRKELAEELLSSGITPVDVELQPDPQLMAFEPSLAANLAIPFPGNLTPTPQEIDPAPNPSAALPKAKVLVVTWTVDEQRALADVMTPGFSKDRWYRYNRKFAQYDPLIRRGAPAKVAHRLGSYFPTKIGNTDVLCFKSELHLNQDGIEDPNDPGNATLPVKDMFHQLIDEVQPDFVLTVGTAGGVFAEQDLGDVVVTRGAKFRVQKEFRNATFAGKTYKSNWVIPTAQIAKAIQLMGGFKSRFAEPAMLPPTARHVIPAGGVPKLDREYDPDIWLDDGDRMPEFHPILTTDYFEFGTSKNNLDQEGCAVEMGDAVLGLAVQERKDDGRSTPKWAVVRNCSDPQINGDLMNKPAKKSLQALWAVYYYKGYGYDTSLMSALATWGIIAGV